MNVKTKEFVQKVKAVHGEKYDYSKTVYVASKQKVIITCPEHGDFEQIPSSHLRGRGCPECGMENVRKPRMSTEEFIAKSREVHGDRYDYSKAVFKGALEKVIITCPTHGDFEQQANSHTFGAGKGCRLCANENLSESRTKSTEDFVTEATKVHDGKYTYDNVVYEHGHRKVLVTCPTHGDFEVTPSNHLSRKSGCPECAIISRSEKQRGVKRPGIGGVKPMDTKG